MKISIDQLEMTNFKSHKELKLALGEVVKISGKNGEGKSSIGEAITWNLFGTDTMGNTLDPTPINDPKCDISVTLILSIDDKKIKLQRAVMSGKNTFYINDIPKKATEFKEFVEGLFEKELFLSIFNPNYFSSQHWKEQRSQLLKYVNEPLNQEVIEHMENLNKDALEELLKKYSLAEIDKLHKDRFRIRDKEIERAGAKVATLKEQLEKSVGNGITDLSEVEGKLASVERKIKEKQEINKLIFQKERERVLLQHKEKWIRSEIMKKKAYIDRLNAEEIEEHCKECGQALDYNARETTKHQHISRIELAKSEGKELISELQAIKKQLEVLPEVQAENDISDLQAEAEQLRHVLMDRNRIHQLERDIEEAEAEYQVIRKERNESQAIMEAVKEFVDKKASLMVDKVNGLFTTLTVKLFEKQKNDSIKQTFEIELDGKPFQKLSTAEKVKAGIELIDVLQRQSGLTAPTFIDNAESVLNLALAPGQGIIATVKNHRLKIDGGTAA